MPTQSENLYSNLALPAPSALEHYDSVGLHSAHINISKIQGHKVNTTDIEISDLRVYKQGSIITLLVEINMDHVIQYNIIITLGLLERHRHDLRAST